MAEAVWSDRFRRPPWWLRWLVALGYIARCLPLVLLLIGPDQRDRGVWLSDESDNRHAFWSTLRSSLNPLFFLTPEYRHMARVGWRLLTLLVCLSGFAVLVVSHTWFALGLGACVVVLLCTRLSVADHVITAASRSRDREELLDYLEDRLRWLEARCDDIVIISHSQGGYLAHQLLARDAGRNQAKVIRFVGVGSGLKPIWFLRQARHPIVWLVAWLIPLASLCMVWGTAPLVNPGLSANAAMLLESATGAMSLLAMPLAYVTPEMTSSVVKSVAGRWEYLLDSIFPVGHMTAIRWSAAVAGTGLGFLCGWLLKHYVHPQHRDALELPKPGDRKAPLTWQEFSSQHDMVGRMLLPTLPSGVEQEAIPVLGHPLRDHTRYFDQDGMLARQFAGLLLRDLEVATAKRFGAAGWNKQVSRYEDALRKQHDRRRLFHALLMLGVAAFLLLPRIARGADLLQATMASWLHLAAAMLLLRGLFTWRGRKSHQQAVAALDAELQGMPRDNVLIRILPAARRVTPTVSLLIATVLAFYGGIGLVLIGRVNPQWGVHAPGATLVAAIALAVLTAAVASGYRVKRRWLASAAALASLPVLASQTPQVAGQPSWATTPGVFVIAAVATAVATAAITLTLSAPIPLPARTTPHQ